MSVTSKSGTVEWTFGGSRRKGRFISLFSSFLERKEGKVLLRIERLEEFRSVWHETAEEERKHIVSILYKCCVCSVDLFHFVMWGVGNVVKTRSAEHKFNARGYSLARMVANQLPHWILITGLALILLDVVLRLLHCWWLYSQSECGVGLTFCDALFSACPSFGMSVSVCFQSCFQPRLWPCFDIVLPL